jgi:hypothetical protein
MRKNPLAALVTATRWAGMAGLGVLGLYATIVLIAGVMFLSSVSPLALLYIEIVNLNLPLDWALTQNILYTLTAIISLMIFNLGLPLFYFSAWIKSFSLREMDDAGNLRKDILLIGVKKVRNGYQE